MPTTLFAFRNAHMRTAVAAAPKPAPLDWHDYLRTGRLQGGPLRVARHQYQGGARLLDVVWAELLPLISPRLQALLAESPLSGWTTYPVVLEQDLSALRGYRALGITGRCRRVAFIEDERHVVERGDGYAVVKGLEIDMSTWDGADLFMGSDSGFVIATDRVRQLFKRAKIGNVSFVPAEDVTLTVDPIAPHA